MNYLAGTEIEHGVGMCHRHWAGFDALHVGFWTTVFPQCDLLKYQWPVLSSILLLEGLNSKMHVTWVGSDSLKVAFLVSELGVWDCFLGNGFSDPSPGCCKSTCSHQCLSISVLISLLFVKENLEVAYWSFGCFYHMHFNQGGSLLYYICSVQWDYISSILEMCPPPLMPVF